MKRLLIFALFCLSATGLFAQKVGQTLYVNVSSAALKSSTGFFASNTGTVKFADEATVKAVSGKWVQIQTKVGNKIGWIPYSSMTTKRISAQGNTANASAQEIALAGKGFSPEVESEYKKGGNKDGAPVNYAAVDEMERVTVSVNDLEIFIDQGRLKRGE